MKKYQNTITEKDPGPPVCEPPFCNTGGDINSPTLPENEVYFFHPDHLGSTSYITNIAGETVQFNSYLPFGESFVSQKRTSTISNYLFNGKEVDSETGLYYYGARYYNPQISSWLSVDPIALYDPIDEVEHYLDGQHNGGYFNPRNTSVYGYTYQNPIIYVDPNGKQARAGLIDGRKAIEIRVNVTHSENISEGDVEQTLIDASHILSQNDYLVKIIDDPNAKINLEIKDKPWIEKLSGHKVNGDAGVIGDTQGTKKVPIKAILNIRTIAHEVAHRMGLKLLFPPMLGQIFVVFKLCSLV